MKKRILAIFLCICMTIIMLPADAMAADTVTLDISDGNIVITSEGYIQGSSSDVNLHKGSYIVKQSEQSTAVSNTITIESGDVDLALSGVNITAADKAGITVKEGAVLNLTLTESTNNFITGADGYAGIAVYAAWNGDVYDPENSGHLLVDGKGYLSASGGKATKELGSGAGIGGDGVGDTNQAGGDFGVIKINGGNINAAGGSSSFRQSGAGAGIGGGGILGVDEFGVNWLYCGHIMICGGTVTANGNDNSSAYTGSAGIGSGSIGKNNNTNIGMAEDINDADMTIKISGGNIEAYGGIAAAGIGGSANGAGCPVTIGGNAIVCAVGGEDSVWGGAGIGGGDNGSSANIVIEDNADVIAEGGGAGAGIGGGGGGYATKISIQGIANVIASSAYGAGIGGGGNHSGYDLGGNCGAVVLNSSGVIEAYSGSLSQAVGVGYYCDQTNNMYKNNSLTIGADTEEIWMFTSSPKVTAFWGLGEGQTAANINPAITPAWYTHEGEADSFPSEGIQTGASHSDDYQWQYAENILSLFSQGNEIISYEYKAGHNLSNWACFKQYPVVDVTFADVSIYSGGKGYTGVVDSNGQNTTDENGFVEPGYYITVPENLIKQLGGGAVDLSDILSFTYDDGEKQLTWEVSLYGTNEYSADSSNSQSAEYIYRISAGKDQNGNEIPVNVILTDKNNETEIKNNDQFSAKLDSQYRQYNIGIYFGDLEPGKIKAQVMINGKPITCDVNFQTGNILVRGLSGDDTTTKIVSDESQISNQEVTALIPADTNYYINNSNVEVRNTKGVELLVDNVLDDSVLTEYIKNNPAETIPEGNYEYKQIYLDLVDTQNGNVHLTLNEGKKAVIYWPVPNDYKSGGKYYILHFDKLDRNYDNINSILNDHHPSVVDSEIIKAGDNQYFKFETSSFSPFVLAYEKKSGGSGTTTYYTLSFDTQGGNDISSVRGSANTVIDLADYIPSKEGYTFTGWFEDDTLTNKISSVKLTKNTTVYAGWKKAVINPDNNGVSAWLNTKDHYAYLFGYENNLFAPENSLTRAEAAQIFYNLLLDKDIDYNVKFADVTDDAWYAKAVNSLASLNIIKGVSDEYFEPERFITRAEFIAIAVRFSNSLETGENIFNDLSEKEWFYDYVICSVQYGWISGYEDGTFKPYQTITRAEVTAIVNRILNRSADKEYVDANSSSLRHFADVEKSHWAYYEIVEAANSHDYYVDNGVEIWR